MNIRRSIHYEPAEIRLFMPLLAVLAIAVSWIGLCMLMFCLVNQTWEKELPLRLRATGSSELLPNRIRSPEIVIREDDQVEFNGQPCDTRLSRTLLDLRTKIRGHIAKTEATNIVVFVEAAARYERLIHVLNAFAVCKCSRYHMVFIPPLVGPRLPYVREPGALPESLVRMLKLGF